MNNPTPTAAVSPAKVPATFPAMLLPIDQIGADPLQPRKAFDEAALQELAASIKAEGLLQPILVRPNGKGYHIIDGERRFRAAKFAGLKDVPVLVRQDLKDQDVTSLQLVANLQREDLTLAEQCDAVARLVKTLGTAKAAADKLGKSEAWVSKRASVETMPAPIRKLISDGKLLDVELASSLTELSQVDEKEAAAYVESIRKPERWETPVTRDDVRDAVKDAKAQIAAKAKQAQERAVARAKSGGKPDRAAEIARQQKAQEEQHAAKWKALIAQATQFGKAAQAALNAVLGAGGGKADIEVPQHYSYDRKPCPASVETAEFRVSTRDLSADQALTLTSKTGLTLALHTDQLDNLSAQDAKKIEQALGRKIKWGSHWNTRLTLSGKQVQAAIAKAGRTIEIPGAATGAAAKVKPAPKKSAKKKR